MIKRSITFPDKMYNQLKQLSESNGIPIAAVIKIACDDYIKKQSGNEYKK